MRQREFGSTGTRLSVIGQGTWMMGEKPARAKDEIRVLRLGIDLGLTHVDTAEMYGGGKTEELLAKAIAGRRAEVFLVSKVLPSNASYAGTIRACEQSLRRLGTDHLDLYLLHWWSDRHPISQTMAALERLVEEGKTRFIGVSNLDVDQLEEARLACAGSSIACDQVCYHLQVRGIEYDLIPHCAENRIAVVGYSPFGSGDFPKQGGKEREALERIGDRHGRTPYQVALNFLTRCDGVFAIPKSASEHHVRENAAAADFELSAEDLMEIDRAFHPPAAKCPLAMI
jgi:diketogulonate reductase-like aldo/keto reductase